MNLFHDGHLSEEAVHALRDGLLESQQQLDALEHVALCPQCAARYADSFTEEQLIEPPKALALQINCEVREVKKRRYLLFYNIKVAASVCAALFLLFMMPGIHSPRWKDIQRIDQKWETVSAPVLEFENMMKDTFDKLLKGKVLVFEKTEK